MEVARALPHPCFIVQGSLGLRGACRQHRGREEPTCEEVEHFQRVNSHR